MRKRAAIRQADILGILHASGVPMTAYQILETLRSNEPDIAPPTVYRTLTTLTEQGSVHRLESVKAFVPCRCEHGQGLPILAICNDCGMVDEYDGSALAPQLSELVTRSRFKIDRHIVEIHGQCAECTV